MFDWLKKKELDRISALEAQIRDLENENVVLEQRLSDATKIANGKRVVKCDNKRCIDWENGTCSLPEVKLTCDKGTVRCAEITETIDLELEVDTTIAPKFKFVLHD